MNVLSPWQLRFWKSSSWKCRSLLWRSPLQYSCLENSKDGGASKAAVHGVMKSWTRLKRLSSSSSSIVEKTLGFFHSGCSFPSLSKAKRILSSQPHCGNLLGFLEVQISLSMSFLGSCCPYSSPAIHQT